MRSFRSKPTGWARDNYRHYLAAKFGSAGKKTRVTYKPGSFLDNIFSKKPARKVEYELQRSGLVKTRVPDGHFAKVGFTTDDGRAEWMWVKVEGKDKEWYYGILKNSPVEVKGVKFDDSIYFTQENIAAQMDPKRQKEGEKRLRKLESAAKEFKRFR